MAIAQANTERISGLVIPVEWDAGGKVVAVAIAAFDENTYLVRPGGKGKELLAHLRCQVIAWGEVESLPQNKAIRVQGYQMPKSPKG